MLGPYQLRELRRQLTSLALLLGFLGLTVYLTQDFDLLQTYRRITNQIGSNSPAPESGSSYKKMPPAEASTPPSSGYGSFFGNQIVFLSGVDSDNATMRYLIAGHYEDVRAFCTRLTVYSSAGNFSMTGSYIGKQQDGSCVTVNSWKRRRDEAVNPVGGPYRFLKGVLESLCPGKYSEIYKSCSSSYP